MAVVAAHPDDEVIGAVYYLLRLPRCTVIHVTDGAPRAMSDAYAAGFATRLEYARARREESHAALAIAGLKPEYIRELGFIDQEAALNMAGVAQRLAVVLGAIQTEIVVTHPYEGGHPDHDTAAFAVHAACRLLQAQGLTPPVIVEMTSYHNRSGSIVVGEFLPDGHWPVQTVMLSDAQRTLKRRMLDCYVTQQAMLSLFPVERECFRRAPAYDFSQPPHPGQLFYERFDWGMTGSRWRNLAIRAFGELDIRAL